MKSYFYEEGGDQYLIEHYKNVENIVDPKTINFIQESFLNCYEINDINIKNEDKRYQTYLTKDIFLVKYKDNYLSFCNYGYMTSLKAMTLSFYMPKSTSPKLFKKLDTICIIVSLYLKKDEEDYEYIYFDVSSKNIFNWVKDIIPSINMLFIRPEYYVCYSKITKDDINHILKNYKIKNA